ncbi:hypothetical protein ACFL6X_04475 [Candidatus Latescibacterota bacterium]
MGTGTSTKRSAADAAPQYPPPPSQRQLLRQFTPLALSGVFFPLVPPIINAALARTAEPALALAAVGLARSLSQPLLSPLFSLRQVTTALVRDRGMLSHVRHSSLALSGLATGFLLLLCLPPVFEMVVGTGMGIPEDVARVAWPAFLVTATTPLLGVGRGYYQGVLVHYGRTGPIGLGALGYLAGATMVIWPCVLLTRVNGALLAALALLWGQAVYLAIVWWPARHIIRSRIPERSPRVAEDQRSVRYVILFFVPLAVAGVLGAAGEPLMQATMARTLSPTASLAAFPVCTSVLFLAGTPLWNVQQVVIAHVRDEPSYRIVRRFVIELGLAWTLALGLIGWTPLADWVFGDLIGVTGEIEALAIQGFRWLVAAPLLFAGKSLYYGTLISQAATRHVRAAAVVRLVALALGLVLGVVWLRQPGLLIAIWAMLLSSVAELVSLAWHVRIHWRAGCQRR